MNLIDRLWINSEIKRAMRGTQHYESAEEGCSNIDAAYSVITKYLDDISPLRVQELRKQVEIAEIDLKNKMTLGYII